VWWISSGWKDPTSGHEAAEAAPAPPRAHRDHPDDRRDVLPARDVHAGVAVAAESAFARREPSTRPGPAVAGAPVSHADGDEGRPDPPGPDCRDPRHAGGSAAPHARLARHERRRGR